MQGGLDLAAAAAVTHPQLEQAVEAVAIATHGFGDHEAARGGFGQRIDRGHPAGARTEKRGHQQARERTRIEGVGASRVGDVEAGRRLHQARGELAQGRHQRHPGAHFPCSLCSERRQVDAAGHGAGSHEIDDLPGQDGADRLLRFAGGRAEVRGQDQVGMRAQRGVRGQGFGHERVQRSAGEVAFVQQLQQCDFIDQATPRGVDDVRALLHRTHARFGEQVGGVLGTRDVQGDHVRPRQQFVQRLQWHAPLAGGGGRQERVERGHVHADAGRLACHGAADAAEADHAQPLAFELEAGQAGLGPLPRLHAGVGARDVPGQREQQRDRMFGGGQGVAVGGVHDRDAARRGGLDVDGVHAGAGAADHLQAAGIRQRIGGDRRGRTHQHGIGIGQRQPERFGVLDRGGFDDLPARIAEQGQAIVMDSIARQHSHRIAPWGFS